MGSVIKHLAVDIEGLLRQYKRKKITFMMAENGEMMSDKAAREEISRLQALGHKLLPTGECEGFDPFGGGCPGHRMEEVKDE